MKILAAFAICFSLLCLLTYDGMAQTLESEQLKRIAEKNSLDSIRLIAVSTMDRPLLKQTDSLITVLQLQDLSDIQKSIRSDAKSYSALQQLTYLCFYEDVDPKLLTQTFHMLDTEVQKSSAGRGFDSVMAKKERYAIGQPAPDFTLNDTSGNPFTLSSLKGHIVLLDFWASFCGPCRGQTPNLAKAYSNYKQNGMEIVSVSVDRNTQPWKDAIQEDKMTWINLICPNMDCGTLVRNYIYLLPASYLIDRHGIIIAKDLQSMELNMKLEEIF